MSRGRLSCVTSHGTLTLAFALSCQAAPPAHSPAASAANVQAPVMNSPASPPLISHTFEEDVAFLSQHGPLKVLSGPTGGGLPAPGPYKARGVESAGGGGGRGAGGVESRFFGRWKRG